MKFQSLYIGAMSASFELSNSAIYYAPEAYDVRLDGQIALEGQKTNVFSLFDLEPDKDYLVAVGADEVKIHTRKVSMVIHLADFKNPSKTGDDTLMVQAAISALPEGGLLYFDPGEYHVTCLFLKSHISLYIPKGAMLLGNTEIDSYPLIPGELKYADPEKKELQLAAWEGSPFLGKPSLLTAYFAEDVEIAGQGTIDGQADKSHFWDDVKNLKWGRPRLVYFDQCQHISMQGLTLKNAPCWTVHPYFSDHLGFYDLKISNPKDAPNTDGMDPECCLDIKAIGIYFSVGDDCIALKSGKYYIGQKYKKPCQQAVIRNCYMHEGHGAVVLGSEAGAGVKDLTVERCLFERTDRGFRIKTRRGRGKDCVIDGVHFKDIKMAGVLTPLVINMFYFCDPDGKTEYVWSKKKLPVDEKTPFMGSFVFENITATDAEYALGWFYGLPEQPIKSIIIKNSSFTVKKDAGKGFPAMMDNIEKQSKAGFCFLNVGQVKLENVKAEGYVGEECQLENVGSFENI
jgi:polygalacturonase